MSVAMGERLLDNDPVAVAHARMFPDRAEATPGGFSRRPLRNEALHLLSCIGRCWLRLPAVHAARLKQGAGGLRGKRHRHRVAERPRHSWSPLRCGVVNALVSFGDGLRSPRFAERVTVVLPEVSPSEPYL